jgi:hypothetical protein
MATTRDTRIEMTFTVNPAWKVTKQEDGDFNYRGVEFTRVDRLRGYSDHYRTIRRVAGIATASAATRKELLARIDNLLDCAAAATA